MPKPKNSDAPHCPHCHAIMRANGRGGWRCRTAHGLKPGPPPSGCALTNAQRQKRWRERQKSAK